MCRSWTSVTIPWLAVNYTESALTIQSYKVVVKLHLVYEDGQHLAVFNGTWFITCCWFEMNAMDSSLRIEGFFVFFLIRLGKT